MSVENHTLGELRELIESGKNYRLFKPFYFQGSILINIEKILTLNDIDKLDGKVYSPLEVVPTEVHKVNDKLRKTLTLNIINILKTSPLFKVDDKKHIDFEKRKECEKLVEGVIDHSSYLVHLLLNMYKFSKKLYIHSINVGLIATLINLSLQELNEHHDGLMSEIVLVGGLLHDIGFMKLPVELLNKTIFEYSSKELNLYKKHPELGCNYLSSLKYNIRTEVLKIVYQHHKKLKGDDFPDMRHEKELYAPSLIIGLADEFDLFLSGEKTSTGKTSNAIMSKLSKMHNVFGENIVNTFYRMFRYLA